MTIIKLPNAGDNAHLTITGCEVVQGTYGEQVKFDAANGDTLYVPKESAVRQLLRCGYDGGNDDETGKPVPNYGDVVGDTLMFSRDANPKPGAKPFWSITVSSPGDAHPVAPSKRLTQAAAQKPALEEDDGYGPIDETPKTASLLDRMTALTGGPTDNERARLTAAYFQLWRDVATEQTAVSKNLDLPVDGTSVQAATATIWITFSQKGVQ